MFGAIIIEYEDDSNYPDPVLYTDGDQDSYKLTVLVFSYIYVVETDSCVDNCNEALKAEVAFDYDEGIGAYGRWYAIYTIFAY